jgi:hypothetical protein
VAPLGVSGPGLEAEQGPDRPRSRRCTSPVSSGDILLAVAPGPSRFERAVGWVLLRLQVVAVELIVRAQLLTQLESLHRSLS